MYTRTKKGKYLEPIVSSESPFRRMPIDFPRRQMLYFDGIRLSAEIAGVAFGCLHDLLSGLTKREDRKSQLADDQAVRAMLDAYSIIDAVHRFRELLAVTPGLKHNSSFKLFMRHTKDVKKLRDIVQHLNREVDRIAEEGWAALGTLTWLGSSATPGSPPRACILQAGTFYRGLITLGPLVDTYSTLPEGEIADVSLSTAGTRVNLSTVVDRVRAFIQSLEGSLEKFAEGKDRLGCDILMKVALVPEEAPEGNRD